MRPRPLASATAALLLLSLLAFLPAPARADDTLEDEYEETARVARVTLVKGEVSLLRSDADQWERARPNLPLVEGDAVATGRDSHAEIQIDARNFLRLGPNSALKVVTLREEGVAFSLSEGTTTVRLARFDRGREYFEIDAPRTTVAFERAGLYRIDAEAGGGVRVTAREDGRARVYSENSGFVLRGDRTARFVHAGDGEGDWELGAARAADWWDSWVIERELHLAARLRFEGRERYYDPEVWGAEELDHYGDWAHTREYGYVWRPHVAVVNHYHNWAPYRYGHWRWVPLYGWTWVPDEDWGWAPYHYGRWVFVGNSWCWAPRGYGYNYRRARWRPALVAFVNLNIGGGRHVAWYPLTHGQRDPRGRFWRRERGRDHDRGRRAPHRDGEAERLTRTNPALLRAVTALPEREFGIANVRARQAAGEAAQRALRTEPLSGRLPVVPARLAGPRVGGRERRDGDRETTGGDSLPRDGTGGEGGERRRLVIVRPETVDPPRAVAARPTGATRRTPGVALDEQLRRTRVFNNRAPRVAAPDSGDPRAGGDTGTGAVSRPPRTTRDPRVTPSGDAAPTGDDRPTRRTRPERPDADDNPRRDEGGEAPRVPRARRPARTDGEAEPPMPRERPERPSNNRPAEPPSERREPSSERRGPASERREPPSERRERRSDRHDQSDEQPRPPTRRVEPPRTEPPASDRPQPPARSEPPRREPPPQREPQPREPPRREAPDQQPPRQEGPRQQPPPRQEAPRSQPPRDHVPPPRQERPAPAEPPARSAPRVRPVERQERESPQEERDQR
jgi:hypothetical protein